jgi:hypothetical protein
MSDDDGSMVDADRVFFGCWPQSRFREFCVRTLDDRSINFYSGNCYKYLNCLGVISRYSIIPYK